MNAKKNFMCLPLGDSAASQSLYGKFLRWEDTIQNYMTMSSTGKITVHQGTW